MAVEHRIHPNGTVTVERAFEIATEAVEIARLAYDSSRDVAATVQTHEEVCKMWRERVRGDIDEVKHVVGSVSDRFNKFENKMLWTVIGACVSIIVALVIVVWTALPAIIHSALRGAT